MKCGSRVLQEQHTGYVKRTASAGTSVLATFVPVADESKFISLSLKFLFLALVIIIWG